MEKMIAYCGLVCTECEGYVATQANDLAALEKLAQRARDEWGMADATVASTTCDGCLAHSDRMCSFCYDCAVRACGMERGVLNCAYCDDYGCDKLEAFWQMAPEGRTTLDTIRAGLVA
jgi:hypothetical protein